MPMPVLAPTTTAITMEKALALALILANVTAESL